MSKKTVFVVILSTEHGYDVHTCKTATIANLVAVSMMNDTLAELEEAIDDNKEGLARLEKLKQHLEELESPEAVTLYNELYVEYLDSSENHEIVIKKTQLE
jgi:hypothetical protein